MVGIQDDASLTPEREGGHTKCKTKCHQFGLKCHQYNLRADGYLHADGQRQAGATRANSEDAANGCQGRHQRPAETSEQT